MSNSLTNINPKKKLIGRAVTLQLAPARADVSPYTQNEYRAHGGQGQINHQTAIDVLQKGDVLVIDCWGSLPTGGIIGDNLAYYIWTKTGTGFVIDGDIRDLDGISEFNMPGFYKYAVPPAIQRTMVMGINVPARIGGTSVMPGDIVLGDAQGLYFIPPHMVQGVIDQSDFNKAQAEWTRKKIDEGKKASQVDGRPTDPALLKDYEDFMKQKLGEKRYQDILDQQNQAPAGFGPGGGRGGAPGGRGGPGGAPGAPPAGGRGGQQ